MGHVALNHMVHSLQEGISLSLTHLVLSQEYATLQPQLPHGQWLFRLQLQLGA